MATNATDEVVDTDTEVTEEDLRALKYDDEGVEISKEKDEPAESTDDTEESEDTDAEDGQTDTEAQDESTDEAPLPSDAEAEETPELVTFTKEFDYIKGETPEEYARNLEIAYKNSTSEALRLKKLSESPEIPETQAQSEVDLSNPLSLYAKQKMDEEITTAYDAFKKDFPQVEDVGEYTKFTNEVAALSQTILTSQKRLATPSELYMKAAVILGWDKASVPDGKEKLGMAIKQNAAASKSSSSAKTAPVSKVTDAMLSANRKMYPDKTDAEIRKELEPYL